MQTTFDVLSFTKAFSLMSFIMGAPVSCSIFLEKTLMFIKVQKRKLDAERDTLRNRMVITTKKVNCGNPVSCQEWWRAV